MDAVSSREKKRIRQAAGSLPELVRAAVKIHGHGKRAEVAALVAWTGLAGVLGWTPEMVDGVEEEMRRNA